jgi:hypothetical protein
MRVQAHALKLDVPDEWDNRTAKQSPEHATLLEAATAGLAEIGDPEAEAPFGSIGPSDVYIRIEDLGAPPPYIGKEGTWRVASLPIRIEASQIRQGLRGGLRAGVIQPLVINGRAIMVSVGFGSVPTRVTLAQANSVLGTLGVGD